MAFRTRATIAGLTLAFALGASAPVVAEAPAAVVSAAIAPEGYARITLSFDRLPKPDVRIVNSILVIGFDRPVTLQAESLARGLAQLAGVVRRDPDGTAIRIALQKPVKLQVAEAGETLFVDLLPPTWNGMPPPLPKDVIEALSRDARAGREIRAAEARRAVRPLARLTVEGATHPTFSRLIFGLGGDVDVDFKRTGGTVRVAIGAPYRFDAAAARALLPTEFSGLTSEMVGDRLVVTVPVADAKEVRGFREDEEFILDVDRGTAPVADPSAAPEPAAAPERAAAPQPVPAAPAPAATAPRAHVADPETTSTASPRPLVVAQDAPPVGAAPQTPIPARSETQSASSQPFVRRAGDTYRIVFPFARPTPAAIFVRGRTLWAVFDDDRPLDLSALSRDSGGLVVAADQTPLPRGRAARLKLADERLASVATEGESWIVSLGDDVLARSATVDLKPSFDRDGRAAMQVDAPGLGSVRRVRDPEVGDEITVATLAGPARGFARPRAFVEFQTLATAPGLAFLFGAEDARAVGRLDQLFVERDGGLILSSAAATEPASEGGATLMNAETWRKDHDAPFADREHELLGAAALSSLQDRPEARFDLARFYAAHDRSADAKAILEAIVEDGGLTERDDRLSILRAMAEVRLGRSQEALSILAAPALRLNPEAALWRAAAEAAEGSVGKARISLRTGDSALAVMPSALQARFVGLGVKLAIDAGDSATAAAEFDKLDVLPAVEGVAARDLIRARLAEALGRADRALAAYGTLAKRGDSAASAEAELRSIDLGLKVGKVDRAAAIERLERLTIGWRGDWIEAAALARLIELYGDAGRWRDAFSTLRVAVQAFPDADGTRTLQDRMQERFTDLFLGAGADSLPKLDALALFYDFKELSPGGKRGDELVRKLADRLVEVDLFDQAADLLDYQIDNRLSGAARAQVAARAALVDMMNGKPAKALEVLRKTRQADLPASLLQARLRLEARALADTGRVDLALEMADGLAGADAAKLKADILWTARRWPDAGEALETTLGTSWRAATPLDDGQRADVMRAAIALSLAGDGLGLDRIRQKFAAKMAESPQSAAFEVVTAPIETRGDAFREIARSIAASSSFDAFVKEYRARAAEETAAEKPAPASAPAAPGEAGSRA